VARLERVSDYSVIDIETTGSEPWRHELVSVGIGRNVHRPDKGRAFARMLMARPGTVIVAHTNYDLRWLMLDGATLAEGVHYHDTKVMAWLLDGTQELDLDSLAQRYLGYSPPKPIKMRQGRVMFESRTLGLVPIEDVPWDEMEAYNYSDIKTEGELYEASATSSSPRASGSTSSPRRRRSRGSSSRWRPPACRSTSRRARVMLEAKEARARPPPRRAHRAHRRPRLQPGEPRPSPPVPLRGGLGVARSSSPSRGSTA
jgi:hypothetical protein